MTLKHNYYLSDKRNKINDRKIKLINSVLCMRAITDWK